jgi:MFS transporter, DHA2 family, multidrug resistance protein
MSDEPTVLQGNKTLITAAAMIAGLMAFLDISIVNVALSDIRANIGTPLDQIAWVSTAYAMANITIIPMSGWLLRRFGFRRYYTSSILLFTAASVLCGCAWDLRSLVVFRILQGLGGGAIIPTSQSVLFSRYPQKQHGMAGALFGIGAISGPLLGPTIGGYLVEWSSWHFIFFVNLPLGLLAGYLAWTRIEQPSFASDRSPVDRLGIALLAIGMASLQYVL